MNVTASGENPYQSPQAITRDPPLLSAVPTPVQWKSVLKRWEFLRLAYNVIVGVTGLLVLTKFPSLLIPGILGDVIVYGLLANMMYLLGPVTELYLNWFVDAWEGRFVPRWSARVVRSRCLTLLLFAGGSLFSVIVTMMLGLGRAL